MIKINTHIKRIFIAFLLVVFCFVLISFIPNYAYATTNNYSTVLDDLGKDKSFSQSNYPVNQNDNSVQVIQIAESTNKELFVYVYQPSSKYNATSINISISINDKIAYNNYKLKLISKDKALSKYIVENFTVKTDTTRYYAISSIYRLFDASIDKEASNGNTITEVAFPVNKQYCFSKINGNPYCSVIDIETIVVTDKFVGFVRYKDGFNLYNGACDSHFVAFNTDKPIDRLLEADVYYTSQQYRYAYVMPNPEKEEFTGRRDNIASLKYTDKVVHTGNGLFATTYKWDRISNVDDFIKNENVDQNVYAGATIDVNVANKITAEGIKALKGKKWVLRFCETQYEMQSGNGIVTRSSTLVGDVSILRLKFETDGITYNLGIIDNKQTGSNTPINTEETSVKVTDNFKMIIGILLTVLLLLLLAPAEKTYIEYRSFFC